MVGWACLAGVTLGVLAVLGWRVFRPRPKPWRCEPTSVYERRWPRV